jgi:hypothetical protein
MNNDFILSKLKLFNTKSLVFILFKDTQFGYRAFESKHSIMTTAKSRPQLIEEIRKEVTKHFDGRFYGKIILRELIDEEIML